MNDPTLYSVHSTGKRGTRAGGLSGNAGNRGGMARSRGQDIGARDWNPPLWGPVFLSPACSSLLAREAPLFLYLQRFKSLLQWEGFITQGICSSCLRELA